MKVVNIKQEGIKTFFVTWTIHDFCNFRCSYCPAGLNEGKRRQVTFEHVKKLFTVLKSKLEPDRKIIFAFSGGEPTLHPEFLEIVKYLYDNGVEVTMTTNGGKGVEWWREIEPYIAHMVISYHPEFSKFDKILEKVEFLHEHCWVNIDMMMDPKYWDEQMAYTERFKQFEKNISIMHLPIQQNFGTTNEGLLSDYTDEHIAFLANPTNYITFFEKFGQFSIIEAFTTFDDQYLDDDNIIYLILVPDIQLTLKSNETYFDIPLSRFKLTNAQRDRIYQLLDESGQKIVTTVVKILDPVLTKYVVNIALTIFEGNDPDTIKSQITSILSDYFLNIRRRDKIPRSDLIAAIESISGVDSVSLYFVGESNEAAKLQSPNSPDIGFDEFGDIVMGKDEIVVISGGWEDRNGIYYDYGAGMNTLSSVNIDIRSIVPVTYNTRVNNILKSSLNTGN
jgi:organic radical activating enzyme